MTSEEHFPVKMKDAISINLENEELHLKTKLEVNNYATSEGQTSVAFQQNNVQDIRTQCNEQSVQNNHPQVDCNETNDHGRINNIADNQTSIEIKDSSNIEEENIEDQSINLSNYDNHETKTQITDVLVANQDENASQNKDLSKINIKSYIELEGNTIGLLKQEEIPACVIEACEELKMNEISTDDTESNNVDDEIVTDGPETDQIVNRTTEDVTPINTYTRHEELNQKLSIKVEGGQSEMSVNAGTRADEADLREANVDNVSNADATDAGINVKTEHFTYGDFNKDCPKSQLVIKQEYDDIYSEGVSQSSDCSIKILSVGTLKDELKRQECGIPDYSDAVKLEATGDDFTSFDYPNYDDSMDSNEAAAFCRVETCLQEDGQRIERNQIYDDKQDLYRVIKEEEHLTVTDTHIISNKLTNTSLYANPYDVLIKSKKGLVMEIRPMSGRNFGMKSGNPEEILPTIDNYDDYEAFQLNSITGDVASLEQEAYGLLKAKTKTTRRKKHVCPKCGNAYASETCLKRHLKVHDTIEKQTKTSVKRQKAKIDNQSKKVDSLKSSIGKKKKNAVIETKVEKIDIEPIAEKKTDKEGYVCICGDVFRRRIRMETCMRSHNTDPDVSHVKCTTCSKNFNSKEELAFHRKRVHRKRFPCKFCPTDYDTGKDLFEHLKIHRQVQLTEFKVISEMVNGKEILKCFMCNNSFKELPQLKCHVMEDHVEPYSCRYCRAAIPNIIDFAKHIKSFHPEVEGQSLLDVLEAFSKLVQAWKCEECGMQFHEADKLALHQAETHNPDLREQLQIQCEDCRRVFVSHKGLQSHRRVHHSVEVESAPPEEAGVMCVECRKMCKDMEALTSHMRLHSPERKFPCKFCDFRFATAEKRRVHQELHTGDMKYVCFICEYQCTSENRLKLHKRSAKHQSMKEYLLSGASLTEEKPAASEERKNKKETRFKKRKKERDRSAGSGSSGSSVLCDVCGDKFPSKSLMLEHKQSHPFIEFPNEDKPTRIFFKYH